MTDSFTARRLYPPSRRNTVFVGRDERHAAEWILGMAVIPGTHEQPVRPVLAEDRQHDPRKRIAVASDAGAARKGDIHRRARPKAATDLLNSAGTRVERSVVRREIEHVGRADEEVLRPVAVVGVPVDDGHPRSSPHEGRSRNGNVVE